MKKTFKYLGFITTVVVILMSCTQIKPTEAGFKVRKSGDYRGVDSIKLENGYIGYLPWLTEVITIPTTQQHVVWTEDKKEGSDGNQEITVSCLGGAGFKMDVGFNYTVNAFKASRIYLKFGTGSLKSISETFLRNAVRGSMQDVSGTMTVDSLLNSLPLFEHTVKDNLSKVLNPIGFQVDLFNILSQPRPSDPSLAKSINDKIKAKQDAERTKMELQSSIAEAEKAIASARGDSASKVITAAGEAEAIRKKQSVLTAEYVDYIRATSWNGVLPSTVLGSGTNFLFSKQ